MHLFSSVPSLFELSTYICDEADLHGPGSLDVHFRPQWMICPHCDMRFDAIGKLEAINHDMKQFVKPLHIWVSKTMQASSTDCIICSPHEVM